MRAQISESIKNGVLAAFDEILQWFGALFIIAGHMFNAKGIDGWNIVMFALGTFAFFIWSFRVGNKPQMTVNTVALVICALGLWRVGV